MANPFDLSTQRGARFDPNVGASLTGQPEQGGAPLALEIGVENDDMLGTPAEQPQEEGHERGFLRDTLWHGAAGGLVDTVNSATDLAHGIGGWAVKRSRLDNLIDYNHESHNLGLPEIDRPERTAGSIVRPVTNFLAGFAAAGKLKLAQGIKGVGKRGLVKGGVADGVFMNPDEELLIEVVHDLISDKPELQGPILSYLSDKDKPETERRLLRTLEGFGLGVATEGVFHAFRGLKKLRHGASKAEADQAIRESVDNVDDVLIRAEDSRLGVETTTSGVRKPAVSPDGLTTKRTVPISENKELLRNRVREYIAEGKTIQDLDLHAPMRGILNYHKHGSTDQTKGMFETVLETVKESWDDGVMRTRDVRVISEELAEIYGTDANRMIRHLNIDSGNVRETTQRYHASKIMADWLADDVATTSRKLANSFNDVEAARWLDELEPKLEQFAQISTGIKNLQKEISRSLGSMREAMRASGGGIDQMDREALGEVIERLGGRKSLEKWVNHMSMLDNPKQVMGALNKVGTAGKFWEAHNTLYLNNLLSGFKTHAVNVGTTAVKTAVMPGEMMLGGMVQGARTGDYSAVRKGANIYVGLMRYTGESIRLAAQAIKRGGGIIDPGNYRLDVPGAERMMSKQATNDVEGAFGTMWDYLSQAIRMPMRFMMTEDELFKQVNYRAKAYADLFEKATDMGIGQGLSGRAARNKINEFIDSNMHRYFDEQGTAINKPNISYARQSTFTNDLHEHWPGRAGGKIADKPFSASLQNMVNNHPVMRIVFPFVRTPANLLRDLVKRTPGAGTQQFQWKHAYKQGGEEQAQAIGQQMFGGMLWLSAIGLAMSGKITSGGPTDRHEYRTWRMGETPYSYVTEDGKRISINRAAPFSLPFTMAADYVHLAPYMTDDELSSAGTHMIKIMSRYLNSQTYMSGLTQFVDAVHHSDAHAEIAFRTWAGNYVPWASFFNQLRQGVDEEFREIDSLFSHVKNRLPGMSQGVPTRYNWLTGEPLKSPPGWQMMDGLPGAVLDNVTKTVSPYPIERRGDQSFVLDELIRLRIGLSNPERKIGGVELTAEQYSELNHLTGTIKLRGGRTLLEELERNMLNPRYDLERKHTQDPEGEMLKESFRHERVREIVAMYKKAAREQLIHSDPELQKSWREHRDQLRGVRRPPRSSIDTILNE